MITARGIRVVAAGDRDVLQGVDLAVLPGRVRALVGPSGSGKTTLARVIAGLVVPTDGAVERDPTVQPGFLHQRSEAVLHAATVVDELVEVGRSLGMDRGAALATALRCLGAVGLPAQVADADPLQLPTGTQRLAALAAVLIAAPQVLVLDEPTAGVGVAGRWRIAALLAELAAAGVGVLLVTHDLRLVATCADDVTVLRGGRVVADGPAAEILGADALAEAGLEQLPEWVLAAQLQGDAAPPLPAATDGPALLDHAARALRALRAGGGRR